MPTNLELKVRYASASDAIRLARDLKAAEKNTMHQTDTYFLSGSARLKLREIMGEHAELIFYKRPNSSSKRYSEYRIVRIGNRRATMRTFSALFGIDTVIVKRRVLFLYKNARIHVDTVRGLGNFIEFEVLVLHGRKQAELLMAQLQKHFGITRKSSIGGSYSDLLIAKTQRNKTGRFSSQKKK